MLILGLNMFHADASAAIAEDGKILFAVAEERLTFNTLLLGRIATPTSAGKSNMRWRIRRRS